MSKILIPCAGCGRTQSVRQSKVEKCSYYTCSGSCKANADWEHPLLVSGFIRLSKMNAAGSFWGHTVRQGTEEELSRVARAKNIAKQGLSVK